MPGPADVLHLKKEIGQPSISHHAPESHSTVHVTLLKFMVHTNLHVYEVCHIRAFVVEGGIGTIHTPCCCDVVRRSDCILVYGSTTKGDVVKRSNCILVYGSTTKGDVVKRSNCILVYGSTTKGDVVRRSGCILVYGSTTKDDVVRRSGCILVYGSTINLVSRVVL